MTEAWRIKATFADSWGPKNYLTPDVRHYNPGWGEEVFRRTIERLEFTLPTGHVLIMSGMEQYNFFVEAAESFHRKGNAQIVAFWFCGKLPGQDIVEMWRVGDGKVVRMRAPWGREWGGSPTTGWKLGIVGDTIISTLIKE
jgi:hypothetical protein